MIPIMDSPKVVRQFTNHFSTTLSYHQTKRTEQYLTGIITGRKFTVRSITSRLVEPADQSSLNRFLTLYHWDEEELNLKRLESLQSLKEIRWRKNGVVAIDDTLLPKTGKKMPGAAKFWDHNTNSYVYAQCIVTSHYVDRDKDYPIYLKQYLKRGSPEAAVHGFKTKVELALEHVDYCETLGSPVKTYVFDAWFLCKKLTDRIKFYGKGWVSKLKSNRIVHHKGKEMSVKEFGKTLSKEDFREIMVRSKSYWVHTMILNVNKLGRVQVVVCHNNEDREGDPVYLVTNRLHWDAKRVVFCYSLRFRIDNFYKDAKQNLGLGGCQLRSLKGTRRHWLLGFLAYSLLRIMICRSRLYKRVNSDQTIGAECKQAFMDLLQSIAQWVYRMAVDGVPFEEVLSVILK